MSVSVAKPGENVSVNNTMSAPALAALAIIVASRTKFEARSPQTMSCWIAAMRVIGPPRQWSSAERLQARHRLSDDLVTLAEGEPHEVSPFVLVSTVVEHHGGDPDDSGPLRQRAAKRHAITVGL